MKALQVLRTLAVFQPNPNVSPLLLLRRFYSAQPEENHNETETDDSVFDSSHFALPETVDGGDKDKKQESSSSTWDVKFRERADKVVFGEERKRKVKVYEEDEDERRNRLLAKTLLQAALEDNEEEEEEVKEEDQKSLTVGIIGAPNAGKSALTNFMVCSFLS